MTDYYSRPIGSDLGAPERLRIVALDMSRTCCALYMPEYHLVNYQSIFTAKQLLVAYA